MSRMRRRLLAYFTVLAIVVGLGGTMAALLLGMAVPRLDVDSHYLDLGDSVPNEIKRGSFILSNSGTATARFALSASCGCTELSPFEGALAPEESTTVRVAIQMPGHTNAEKSSRITISELGGNQPPLTVAVVARCPAPFRTAPLHIDFGRTLSSDAGDLSREIKVESWGGGPPLMPADLLATHESKSFRIMVVSSANGGATVNISPIANLATGDYFDTVDLRLKSSPLAVRVPVRLQICAPIAAIPETVFLRRDAETKKLRPIDLLITGAKTGLPSGRLVIVQSPGPVRVEEISQPGRGNGKLRRCRLWFDAEPPERKSAIQVGFEGAGEACQVNVLKAL